MVRCAGITSVEEAGAENEQIFAPAKSALPPSMVVEIGPVRSTGRNLIKTVKFWKVNPSIYAQVVKLVDTPASGAGGRKAVEVQVLSWAPLIVTFCEF